ncbi:MAG: 4-hydroxy-3-methylbut-2-en-1-yl diphosphate synthase [Acidiferrobacteraceae bacterium]|jgi:(E)-4-hydroxy-3-methylbut-2-enyl-diphosphate synthase|nr:4-hydroxy-3-methylbut-2-en-1-yl diphosphate synthase [Acidiferrobacteraceae bacterium]|tara:strand:+ start:3512 stop:4738 length:1227 start_codon:yes stop_codon:yes gene_type:complete
MKPIRRASTVAVSVGNVTIGGSHPIVVQSMTNTETADVEATTNQIQSLVTAGSELVRIPVNTAEAAQAVPEIYAKLKSHKCDVPLIGDFHFNGHKLLQNYPDCAKSLAKYRINPGNVGRGSKHNEQFSEMIECALRYNKPIRIGVNWGSLDPDLLSQLLDENASLAVPRSLDDIKRYALVESVLRSADFAKKQGLPENKIILSCKVSAVPDLISIYQELSLRTKLPLHLGLTEAGMGDKGIVSSVAGLAILIQKGVADTIRVSLTPEPGGDRAREVRIAQEILQSIGVRSFTPQVVSCPGCGRTSSDYFQRLAKDIENYIRNNMPTWKKQYQGVEEMTVAVMGCVVNGPGESKNADIGISLPGSGERPVAPVYENGQKTVTLKGSNISQQFIQILEAHVANQYAKKSY